MTHNSPIDLAIQALDGTLRTLFVRPAAQRARPGLDGSAPPHATALTAQEQRLSAGLMRVNHVGEVCAQALYTAQALATRNAALRAHFLQAGNEEADHLAWTAARLDELGARPSVLNPLWYAGAFGLGLLAGRLGDAISLGFVAETEAQVGAHLQRHLERLPAQDHASRAIVAAMRDDELRHAESALAAGATELAPPVKSMMRGAARLMTGVAHHI